MTLFSDPVLIYVWIVAMLAQGYVFALLVGRKAYRDYPAFTALMAYFVSRSLVLFYLATYAAHYYSVVQWAAYGPQLVFLVATVREVFHILFHPYSTLPRRTVTYFGQATVAVVVVAIAFAVFFPGAAQPTVWMQFARKMDQVVSWVLCAVFGFIALFASYFGVPWRHRLWGVGIGFLFYMSVDVTTTTVVALFGLPPYSLISRIDSVAFITNCIVWCYYFTTPETPRSVPTLEQLRKIQAVLRDLAITVDGMQNSVSGHTPRSVSLINKESGGVCDERVSGQ